MTESQEGESEEPRQLQSVLRYTQTRKVSITIIMFSFIITRGQNAWPPNYFLMEK